MPSLKLIGMFGALFSFGLALMFAFNKGAGLEKARGEARYNALVAIHAQRVITAQDAARGEEREQAAQLRKQELEAARASEARIAARLATTNAQLRSLRDAANVDPDFARCLALPLPDGMRREPATP